MFPRGRSSVYDYKLCVPEGDNSVQGEKWKPCVSGKGSSVLFCMHKEALCFNVTGALCLNEK